GKRLPDRRRTPEVVPLAVVDAEAVEQFPGGVVTDELGDRARAETPSDVDDGLDDEPVGRVGDEVGDELAVDLQVVEVEVLEVVERGEARAEVVEREFATERAQIARELARP